MTTTKEVFHEVTAEMSDGAVLLTQPDYCGESSSVLMHPLQLRHFAERFAGMEPVGWMTSQPVKTLARRLRTLAFHIDFLYDYLKNHSDHKHADLSFELSKAIALTEMADEFCADLPDELCETDDEPTQTPQVQAPRPAPAPEVTPSPAHLKGRIKPKQSILI